jgi:hypothetical protein
VQRYFYAWQTDWLWERINFVLLQQAREGITIRIGALSNNRGEAIATLTRSQVRTGLAAGGGSLERTRL